MKAGITAYGAYIPWRRLNRAVVASANAWFAPELKARGRGHRAMTSWDEDSVTLAVAAARDSLGDSIDRGSVDQVILASTSLPFADRLNAGVVAEALRLRETITAQDVTGSTAAPLAALSQALTTVGAHQQNVLLVAADNRKSRAASSQELNYGDGGACLMLGTENVLAEMLGEAALTVDFVDHFRTSDREVDYAWEERWVRDQGISQFLPKVISSALENSGITAAELDYFIFPTVFNKMDVQLAKRCGISEQAIVDNLSSKLGDTGSGHGMLMLANILPKAKPGQTILLSQFGNGAHALVFRVTDAITGYRPQRGVQGWLQRAVEENNYTRFLSYKGQLQLERGMRGEQDKKTALTTAYRYRKALLGFVAGRCRETGHIHFPPSRLTYSTAGIVMDTQDPYPLAERRGRVLSWSAESLSSYMAPPHHYGQVDFDGGGRVLMEFTDVEKGDIETGIEVEMVFRIKDIDELRGFKRYFWKATPVQHLASTAPEV